MKTAGIPPGAHRVHRRLALLPLAVACLNASAGPAQTTDEPGMQLVVVTASRSQATIKELPLHTTIGSRDKIEKSPAQNVDQLMRNVPGMNFTAVPAALSDPTGHQTKMRGLGNAKVLVLLDGIPIHDPFYLTTQWYKVPLSSIERIEVLRGGNSSLWGNMAVAGVVNIVTRRVHADAGEVIASAGTHGTVDLAMSKGILISDMLGLSVFAEAYHTDGYQATPAAFMYRFPQKRPVKADNRNIQIKADVTLSPDLKGYVRVGYHTQDQQISYVYGRNLQENPDFAAQLERKVGPRANLQANAWAQYVHFDKLNGNTCYYEGGTTCLTSSSGALTPSKVNDNVVQFYTQQGALRYRERGASLIYSGRYQSPLYSVLAGLDYRRLSAEDSEWFFNTPNSPTAPQSRFDSSTRGEGAQTFTGLFAQARYLPLEALDISLSGRLDRYDIDDRMNMRTLASGVSTGGPLPKSSKTAFNPSLAARYDLADNWSVRAAAYKAFRAPGFNNLTRTYGTGTSTTIANPDLVPEDLRGWEIGSDYRSGRFIVGATYFLYNIHDMIATYTASGSNAPAQVQLICGGPQLPNCGGSAKYYTNDQDGRAHGVELVASLRYSRTLTFDGNYNHTDSFLTHHGAIVTDPLHVQLVGIPRNVALLSATWKPQQRIKAYAEARYTGPMLLDTTSNGGTARFGQGGAVVLNASLDYAWNKAINLFVSAQNLTDREYGETPYGINQPYNRILSLPRTVNAGVRMRF
jgi:outer membrane receptor protein involved in Fe transport